MQPQKFDVLQPANGGTGLSGPGTSGGRLISDGLGWIVRPPSMFKARSTVVAAQALAASGTGPPGLFPASFFGVTDYIAPDFAYTPANNTLLVGTAGPVQVRLNAYFTTPPLLGTWYLTMLRNGVAQELSQNFANATVADGMWLIPCAAGDTLQPGFVSTTTASVAALAAQLGKLSFWQAYRA